MIVKGYASHFHKPDQSGDIILPGAFRQSLVERGTSQVRMLFNHDVAEPIGIWKKLREDAQGLWVEGELTPGAMRSDDLEKLISHGAIDGFSIGFVAQKTAREKHTGRRLISKLDLWEISIVTFPMMTSARLNKLHNADLLTSKPKRGTDARTAL
jgi:HK97 family phage prohead protease